MNTKRKDDVAQILMQPGLSTDERCHCLPLSSLQAVPLQVQGEEAIDHKVTCASPELSALIRAKLEHCFPRATPLGLLLLHVSQLEHITIHPQSALLHKRQRLHASAGFLEQVLVNVRRAIRECDELLIHEGTGAAIIFPEVDRQGLSTILERVSRNVDLLQAETVIPPLKCETTIALGIGSYPECGPSVEHLLNHVSVTAHQLTLRPAISAQLLGMPSTMSGVGGAPFAGNQEDLQQSAKSTQSQGNIPFMQLPVQLPTRLKQLIPYQVALELRCVSVGRDHHCLTVAMADSSDSKALDSLQEITGLTIFPVSCDVAALNALLVDRW